MRDDCKCESLLWFFFFALVATAAPIPSGIIAGGFLALVFGMIVISQVCERVNEVLQAKREVRLDLDRQQERRLMRDLLKR